jgi:hypothetical protein
MPEFVERGRADPFLQEWNVTNALRDVVVTGMNEMCMVNQKVQLGGFAGGGPLPSLPSPKGRIQRTLLMTSLKSPQTSNARCVG